MIKLLKTVAIVWSMAFAVSAIAGFLYARNEIRTIDRGISPAILRGISIDYIEDKIQLSLRCPGTQVLYRYEVGTEKASPDLAGISAFEMYPPLSIATAEIPEIGIAGTLSVIGGSSVYTRFMSGKLGWNEFLPFGLGLASGAFLGYYVGCEIIPPSCGDSNSFVKAVSGTDWPDISDGFFANWYQNIDDECGLSRDFRHDRYYVACPFESLSGQPLTEEEVLFAKVHCGGAHVTADDYKFLRRAEKQCQPR